MGWKVAVDFVDICDGNRLCRAGEPFPRPGLAASEKRLAELAGSGNRVGCPLIIKDGENAPEKPKAAPRKRGVKKDA